MVLDPDRDSVDDWKRGEEPTAPLDARLAERSEDSRVSLSRIENTDIPRLLDIEGQIALARRHINKAIEMLHTWVKIEQTRL